MEKKLKIQRVSSEFLGRVIEHRVPLGLFLAKEGGLWVAVDNLDELPMRVVEPLSAIAIEAWSNEEDNSTAANAWVAQHYRQRLENYRLGIGRRPGEASR